MTKEQDRSVELNRLAAKLRTLYLNSAENQYIYRAADELESLDAELTGLRTALAQQGAPQPMTDAEYQHMTANGAKAWAGVDPQELRTGAVLTDAEIIAIAVDTMSAEPGRDGYVLPITFARAILAAHSEATK